MKELKAEVIQPGEFNGGKWKEEEPMQADMHSWNGGGLTYYADTNADSDIGNITRIESILKIGIAKKIEALDANLEDATKNLAEAERTKDAPFEYADELREKTARLEQLDKELNIDKQDEAIIGDNGEEINLDPPQKPEPPKHGRR